MWESGRARFRNHPSGIFSGQQTGALPESSAADFQRSGKPLVKSLPCAKGGGTRQRDGGIVIQRKHKNNPSVSFADSSLYTREPFLASAPPSTSLLIWKTLAGQAPPGEAGLSKVFFSGKTSHSGGLAPGKVWAGEAPEGPASPKGFTGWDGPGKSAADFSSGE